MSGAFPEITSLSVEDLDEYEQMTTPEGWDLKFLQVSAGKHSGQYYGLGLTGMYLTLVDYGRTSISVTGAAPRHLSPVILPLKIGRSLRFQGRTVTEADAFFPSQSDEVDFAIEGGVCFAGLYLTQDVRLGVRRAVHGSDADAPGGIGQEGLITGSAVAELKSRISELFEIHSTAAGHTLAPVNADDVSRSITTQVVRALSGHDRGQQNPDIGCGETRAVYARKARDFMETNRHETLSLAALSAETGVSVRTLQYAFSDCYGVSPARYHLLRRLKGARDELKHGNPRETTVTEIATNWGFWHFGRFSQAYKSRYGELPSQTLASQFTRLHPVQTALDRAGNARPTGDRCSLAEASNAAVVRGRGQCFA